MKKQYVWLAGMAFALGTAGLGAAQIFQEKGFAPTPLIAVGGMLASEILTSLLTLLLLLFQTPVFAPPSLG